MKKQIVLTVLTMMAIVSIASITPQVFAAFNDHIPSNQGTEIINGKDGCQAHGGTTAVILGPASPFPPPYPQVSLCVVEGGACCASNKVAGTTQSETTYYEPNQCCNPPDYLPFPPYAPTGEHYPDNHCPCFAIREYAVVL